MHNVAGNSRAQESEMVTESNRDTQDSEESGTESHMSTNVDRAMTQNTAADSNDSDDVDEDDDEKANSIVSNHDANNTVVFFDDSDDSYGSNSSDDA